MAGRWKRRPHGSNWGDFGADDQLGRLNLLTPQKVLQGIAEVREGRRTVLEYLVSPLQGTLHDSGRER